MTETVHRFPHDFKWGTATSAHQVEGDNKNNQWWVWEQTSGRIKNGDTSGAACDWWNSAEADFDRMSDLDLNAHRLSIEWSRVEPRDGLFDNAAIDRYRAMLLELRRRGIEPMVTLHHFTNPLWLQELGGWEQTDVVVPRFARFVTRAVRALGDLCDLWCTINEPNIYATVGYLSGGEMPPGGAAQFDLSMAVLRNMLLGHGAAYEALHREQPGARVGLAHHMRSFQPLHGASPLDNILAKLFDAGFNQSILTALTEGKWNLVLRRGAGMSAQKLRGTLDWIGLNYYSRQCVTCDPHSPATLFARLVNAPGIPVSDFDYGEIYPNGLLPLLRQLSRHGLPIYITENGLPDADDDQRPEFLVRHLHQVALAARQGCPVRGYYHWSLVDNFEWSQGWRMKFGLYELDPLTQARKPRRSAFLYRDIVRCNSIGRDTVDEHTPALATALFA